MDFELFKKINDERWNYGELEDASVISVYRNTGCGDGYRIFLKIEGDTIKDATYTTTGCGFGLVSLAMATEWVKNKKISEAIKVSAQDIEDTFAFPPRRKNYPESAAKCLQRAIADYQNGTGLKLEDQISKKKALIQLKQQGHLRNAQLKHIVLSEENLMGCDLSGANLSQGFLNNVNLSEANLKNCNFRGAFLNNADLSRADLSGADLRWAKLSGSDLADTKVDGAYYDIGTRLDPKYLNLFAKMVKKDQREIYLQKK